MSAEEREGGGGVRSYNQMPLSDHKWIFGRPLSKLSQVVFLQNYGAGGAGSSQSGVGKIIPAHYKACRLCIRQKKLPRQFRPKQLPKE